MTIYLPAFQRRVQVHAKVCQLQPGHIKNQAILAKFGNDLQGWFLEIRKYSRVASIDPQGNPVMKDYAHFYFYPPLRRFRHIRSLKSLNVYLDLLNANGGDHELAYVLLRNLRRNP